jgi:hypothetical protein
MKSLLGREGTHMNSHANSIQLVQTNRPHIYNVKLNLHGKVKLIGVIDEGGEGAFISIRSSKEKHRFHKDGSMGINYELLTSSHIYFKWIIIDYGGRRLVTTRDYALQKGRVLQFSKQGFELQVFVPIAEMNIHIAREFEAELMKKRLSEDYNPSLFTEQHHYDGHIEIH